MNILLDGIGKLRAQRSQSRTAVLEIKKKDGIDEMVKLYEAIQNKSQWLHSQPTCARQGKDAQGLDWYKQELKRWESRFNYKWINLPEEKRKVLVDRLLECGLFPEIVKQALDIFKGTVVSLL